MLSSTKALLVSLLLLYGCACTTQTEDQDSFGDTEVDLVFVIYRHGDRTPIDLYPTDPYRDESQWPAKFGQLTPRGKQMQYDLGKWLKTRYGSILGRNYDPDVLYVRSTDVDRTLMSALSNLAGLFPPHGNQIWNPELLWQPIPVHTVTIEKDKLLSSHSECPRLAAMIEQVLQSPEVHKLNEQFADLYSYISDKAGANVSNMVEVNYIFDTLYIETLYNKTLPDWTRSVFPEKMRFLRDLSFTLTTWTHEMKRLRSGPLIQNVLDAFRAVEKGTLEPQERKMFMYSGHDTTISSFLHALDLFSPPIAPPYAATIMVELRSVKGNSSEDSDKCKNYFVRILYRNDTTVDPHVLRIPGCDTLCSLDQFDALTKELRPVDWDRECQLEVDPVMRGITLVSMVLCVILFLVLLVAVAVHWCRVCKDNQRIYFSINQEEQP